MNRSKKLILLLSVIGMITAVILVANEISTPCYCPSYPVLGIPACYLVLVFFLSTAISIPINSKALFYFGSVSGLLTAIWFSTNQLLGFAKCPVFLGIPLCFVALLTFGLILFLGINKAGKK